MQMRLATNILLLYNKSWQPKDVELTWQNTAVSVVKPERIQFENKVSLRQNKLHLYPDKTKFVRTPN